MPRKSRIDAPGALHHIIVRGIERRAIFRDDDDREKFIEKLAMVLAESRTPCFAYALMRNHVHLLLRTGTVPLATVMRQLLTGYAMHFNRRYRRHGHLFQNRYKSILGITGDARDILTIKLNFGHNTSHATCGLVKS